MNYTAVRLNSDGTVDNSFIPDTGSYQYGSGLTCVVIQPDGKLLLGGYFIEYYVDGEGFDYYYQRSLLIRLNPNGTSDTSFAYASGGFGSFIESVALQADGKVIIGGTGIARLNANGSLDGSFNSGGRDALVALQSDGKVLIGGTGIARLNANGSLNSSFNPELAPAPGSGYLSSIAVQPDGKMLIGGYFTAVNGTNRNNVARLDANGSLDSSFNPGTGADAVVRSIALQSDGKIIIGGDFFTVNEVQRSSIARLKPDGTLDSSFQPGQGMGPISSLVFQADGKLLVGPLSALVFQADGKVSNGGALTFINGTNGYASARFNADGSRDETFIAATNFNPDLLALRRYDNCAAAGQSGCAVTAYATAVAVQADGKVLIGGSVQTVVVDEAAGYIYYYSPVLGRFYADGSLDTNFAPVFFGYSSGGIDDVALQPDGKIIVSGPFVSVNGTTRNGLARLNTDGTLNLSFAPGTGASAWISSVAVQPDGKVLIAGSFGNVNGTNRAGGWRLQANGSLDNNFNAITGPNASVSAFALQPDGKVIIGGSFTTINGTNRNHIARLNANGSLDSSFNPGTGADSTVYSIALQSDGKVLIGGDFITVNGVLRPHVARLFGDSVAPSLNIARFNALVIVSWPSPSTGFVLQQNTDLNPANWTTPSESVTDNGTTWFISVSPAPAPGHRFYRLFKP